METTKLLDYTVYFENREEFHELKREIFGEERYAVELGTTAPLIIDAGAHIGLTTLYFKRLYPQAQVIAIEPNPLILPLLKLNIAMNKLQQVTIVEAALGPREGTNLLYADASGGGWYSTAGMTPGAWNGAQKSRPLPVETRRLSSFLTQPLEVLKLDIEGAEGAVLAEAGEQLRLVKHLLLEFHPTARNKLDPILRILLSEGFRIESSEGMVHTRSPRGLGFIHACR